MRRLLGFTIFGLLLSLIGAGTASATTYYIAANGSDSNNGTTKTTPWAHAPGMPNCASTCASTTPVAGDSIIFRGGDTWHYAASTAPAVGGGWDWTWSGSSGSQIYIGVDKTWYSGSSWARPIINFDNPLNSGGYVTSCTYDYATNQGLNLWSGSYVTVDNFEWTGMCVAASVTYGDAMIIKWGGNYNQFTNNYFHGWTQSSISYITILMGPNVGGEVTHTIIAGNVADGSDTYCTGGGSCEASFAYGDGYDIHQNVIRYVMNVFIGNVYTVHDNLFEYIYEGNSNYTHGNIIESNGTLAGVPIFIYNNIFRHTDIGVGIWLGPGTGEYVFNNVSFDNGNPTNCYMFAGSSTGSTFLYFYNNTSDSACNIRLTNTGSSPVPFVGNAYFKNNHFINYSPAALTSVYSEDSGVTATVVDNGSEVYQTEAAANGQGYLPGNNYAPTLASGATVTASGGNLTGSCSTFSADNALCSGLASVSEATRPSAAYPAISIVARPTSGFWNAGAYQFGTSSAGQPTPPTSLLAIVQ